jgi:hypothetical protein
MGTHRRVLDFLPVPRLSLASLLLVFSLLFFFAPLKNALAASESNSPLALARQNPRALVQQTVRNEVKAEKNDPTHWRFRKVDIKPNGSKTWEIIETKDGEVKHLVAINGHPLDAQQQQAEQQRMQQFLANRAEQEHRKTTSSQDYSKEQQLMEMLPNALLYRYAGTNGNFVTLDFRPNPNFQATTHEAEVFHHMVGKLVIDVKNMRVAQFAGHLASPVEFGWGLLGHLNKGGTFDVRQANVADKHWDMTLLDTQITGKALFFKTISVREKIIESDYRRVSDDLTLQQAANILKSSASRSASQIKKPSRQSAEVAAAAHRH